MILLSFLVTTCFSWLSFSLFAPYAHADYNIDDHYPILYVDILYPVMVVTVCVRLHARAHDEHVDDVSQHR